MIFTLFIAAVFASQSFRGISNGDAVAGEYKTEKKITITHTGDSDTNVTTNRLGFGAVTVGQTAVFNDSKTPLTYNPVADSTKYTAVAEFDYLKFLKSNDRKLIIAENDNKTIAVNETFEPEIGATTATPGTLADGIVPITIDEATEYKNGKLFSYKNDTNITNLTYASNKYTGNIDVTLLYSMVSPVRLGYMSAEQNIPAGGKLASSDIITVAIGSTPFPQLKVNNDGKVEFVVMTGPGNYQNFTESLQKDGALNPVGDGKEEKFVLNTNDTWKYFYAVLNDTTSIPKSIVKIDLEKAPNITLKFVGQDDGAKPKIEIVKGDDFTGTAVVLNVTGAEQTIILSQENSSVRSLSDFVRVPNKSASIYVKNNGTIASVTKVIESGSISLTKGSSTDEKMNLDFTMTLGMIPAIPTHLCIYYTVDGKITTESAKFTNMTWAKEDPSKQSFEYKYADLTNPGDYFAVMTDGKEITTDGKVNSITVPLKLDKTNPNGAFSAVATIFAAIVSLLVFAL